MPFYDIQTEEEFSKAVKTEFINQMCPKKHLTKEEAENLYNHQRK